MAPLWSIRSFFTVVIYYTAFITEKDKRPIAGHSSRQAGFGGGLHIEADSVFNGIPNL
jgi:hypothetical protein